MLALILGGGEGTRLDMGEKPLVMVRGRPLLSHVVEAFELAGCEVMVALTPRTPYTLNWCRMQNISTIITAGMGYVEDLIEAVYELEERNPLFTSVSDLPFLQPATIRQILARYRESEKPACSTWVPVRLLQARGLSCAYVESIGGISSCPSGVNILLGSRIGDEQEESQFVFDNPDLAFHVNTRTDLEMVNRYLDATAQDSSP
jgi:adenosylcobinamide-phosphate guanylyltransferase